MAHGSFAFESALLILDILIWQQIRAPQYLDVSPKLKDACLPEVKTVDPLEALW
jgi:hypothetical protein